MEEIHINMFLSMGIWQILTFSAFIFTLPDLFQHKALSASSSFFLYFYFYFAKNISTTNLILTNFKDPSIVVTIPQLSRVQPNMKYGSYYKNTETLENHCRRKGCVQINSNKFVVNPDRMRDVSPESFLQLLANYFFKISTRKWDYKRDHLL